MTSEVAVTFEVWVTSEGRVEGMALYIVAEDYLPVLAVEIVVVRWLG